MIVVIRYLNDTAGEHRYVEYHDTDLKRESILSYEHFVSRFGSDFKDIPEDKILTRKEVINESDGKQCISKTDLKG